MPHKKHTNDGVLTLTVALLVVSFFTIALGVYADSTAQKTQRLEKQVSLLKKRFDMAFLGGHSPLPKGGPLQLLKRPSKRKLTPLYNPKQLRKRTTLYLPTKNKNVRVAHPIGIRRKMVKLTPPSLRRKAQ